MNSGKLYSLLVNCKQINSTHTFKEHSLGVSDFSINPMNRNELCTASFDSSLKIIDIEKRITVNTLSEHSKGVWSCDYAEMDPLLASGSNDASVIVWDMKSYTPIQKLSDHKEVVYDVKFSGNGKYLSSCSKGQINVYDYRNFSTPLAQIKDSHKEFVYCMSYVGGDNYLSTGLIDGSLVLYDLNTFSEYKRVTINSNKDSQEDSIFDISKFKIKERDNEFLSTHHDGSIIHWKLEDKELTQVQKYDLFNSSVTTVNSSLDDGMLVAGSKDHSVEVWKANDNEAIQYFLIDHTDIITRVDFIANDLVVSASYDTTLRIWRL